MTGKIIFLDIDGVLASERIDAIRGSGRRIHHEFDPVAIELLNDLCHEHQAQVVICSTWADSYKGEKARENLLDYFKAAGFTGDFHADWRVEDVSPEGRGLSIPRWCEQHGLSADNVVIIDDHVSSLFPREYLSRVSVTDKRNGMTVESYQLAKLLLSGRSVDEQVRKDLALAIPSQLSGRIR